jgi:hypothetical protein
MEVGHEVVGVGAVLQPDVLADGAEIVPEVQLSRRLDAGQDPELWLRGRLLARGRLTHDENLPCLSPGSELGGRRASILPRRCLNGRTPIPGTTRAGEEILYAGCHS